MKTQSAACVSPLPEIALHLHAHTHTRTNKQVYQCKHCNKQTCVHGACVCACVARRVCTCARVHLSLQFDALYTLELAATRAHTRTNKQTSQCMHAVKHVCTLGSAHAWRAVGAWQGACARAHTCACVCVLTCFPPAPFKGSGVAKSEEASSHISVLHAIKHVCTWAMRAHACMREVQ